MIAVEARRILRALLLPHTREPAPRGLVSLLDLLERYSFGFYKVIQRAEGLQSIAVLPGKLPDYRRTGVQEFLDDLKGECEALGLDPTRDLASHVATRFEMRGEDYTYADLRNDIENLTFSFVNDLQREVFVRISRDKEPYFQRDALFGPEVAGAFPSSADNIQRAGTCFALGLTDASVFHSMRVLERGLDVIAGAVGVAFDRPTWATVIDAIESAIKKNATAAGVDPKRRKVVAEAAVHLRFVKDAWRNDVMHDGDAYDTGKALSVLDNVRDFMRGLANAGLAEPLP